MQDIPESQVTGGWESIPGKHSCMLALSLHPSSDNICCDCSAAGGRTPDQMDLCSDPVQMFSY